MALSLTLANRAWYFMLVVGTLVLVMLFVHGASMLPINPYPFSSLPQSLQDHVLLVAKERMKEREVRNREERRPAIDGDFQVIMYPEPCNPTHKKPEEAKFIGFLEYMCENEEVTEWCRTDDVFYKATEKVIPLSDSYVVRVIFSCFRLSSHNRFAQDYHLSLAWICAFLIPFTTGIRLWFIDKEQDAEERRLLPPKKASNPNAPRAGLVSRHQNYRRRH